MSEELSLYSRLGVAAMDTCQIASLGRFPDDDVGPLGEIESKALRDSYRDLSNRLSQAQ